MSREELLRVLAPEGVAYVKTAQGWTKTVKPRPEAIGEYSLRQVGLQASQKAFADMKGMSLFQFL